MMREFSQANASQEKVALVNNAKIPCLLDIPPENLTGVRLSLKLKKSVKLLELPCSYYNLIKINCLHSDISAVTIHGQKQGDISHRPKNIFRLCKSKLTLTIFFETRSKLQKEAEGQKRKGLTTTTTNMAAKSTPVISKVHSQ